MPAPRGHWTDVAGNSGRPQFEALGALCTRIADWIQERSFGCVVALETPLGNTLPTQVLHDICRVRGLPLQVVEWGFPRNDRKARGHSVEDAARDFAKEPEVRAADCILLLDDAITGSRFLKLARALRRAAGAERVVCVAMHFRFPEESGMAAKALRDLSKVEEWGRAAGLTPATVELPTLPVFKVDGGAPVFLENEMVWANHDLLAGKRKVNLVFNMIDAYEQIYESLCTSEPMRRNLELLWSEDVSGQLVQFAGGLMDEFWTQVAVSAPPAVLFEQVRSAAEAAFPSDWHGRRFPFNEAEVRARSDWLADCVAEAARPMLGERAELVGRAVCDLRNSGQAGGARTQSRDHGYGHYTMAWNEALLTLNRRLRALVLNTMGMKPPCGE